MGNREKKIQTVLEVWLDPKQIYPLPFSMPV